MHSLLCTKVMLSHVSFIHVVQNSVSGTPQTLPPDNSTAVVRNIIILAGQSNMSGRGGMNVSGWDGVVPPECAPNSDILRLNAALTWEEAQEPLHRDIDAYQTCGVGPGMAFSNSVLQNADSSIGVIGLVPCAIGATNLTQWLPGRYLYNKMLMRAEAALGDGTGIVRAILWYEGENDSCFKEEAPQYEKRLIELITNLRSDLGSPLIPFIQVALASGGEFMGAVRKAQLKTCASLPNVICVDAMGLPLMGDNVHLTTTAQVQLWNMLAYAFLDAISLK